MKIRRGTLAVIGGAGILAGAIAWAATDGKKPTLHEDLPGPRKAASIDDLAGQPIFGGDPQAGDNPTAFANDGKILPEPNKDLNPGQNEPVFTPDQNTTDPNQQTRDDEARPDRMTGQDGTLHYTEVFNPAVIPFKRMNAFDAARTDYTLYSAGAASHDDLSVGGGKQRGRDLFWGSVLVKLAPGVDVPLPSVAPDMRILSYETEPAGVSLTFSKDAADNYYVRTDEPGVSGTHRIVFLCDADQRYFGTDVPSGFNIGDLARQPGAPDLVPLPPQVRDQGLRAARHLGLDQNTELTAALRALVRWFRDFKAQDPPPSQGDIFWDLFINQAGVCRHRSFAFMITANALGLPTRYLTNEAHAWVEVWLPTPGWIRVDLGGAALEMEVSNAADKSMYRPPKKDTFADVRPPNYAGSYTELKGDIKGLTQSQIDEGQMPADPTQKDDAAGDGDGDGDGDDDDDDPIRIGPDKDLPVAPPEPKKVQTRLIIDRADASVYRGERLRVAGRVVTADGAPVPGQRIEIWLRSPQADDKGVDIGTAITQADGSWSAEAEVPTSLSVRRYEVLAYSSGDKTYSRAASE